MWCRNRLHFLIGETCFFDIRSRYFDESQISAHFRTFQNQIQFADFSYLCDRNAAKKGQMLYWLQRGSKQLGHFTFVFKLFQIDKNLTGPADMSTTVGHFVYFEVDYKNWKTNFKVHAIQFSRDTHKNKV